MDRDREREEERKKEKESRGRKRGSSKESWRLLLSASWLLPPVCVMGLIFLQRVLLFGHGWQAAGLGAALEWSFLCTGLAEGHGATLY